MTKKVENVPFSLNFYTFCLILHLFRLLLYVYNTNIVHYYK